MIIQGKTLLQGIQSELSQGKHVAGIVIDTERNMTSAIEGDSGDDRHKPGRESLRQAQQDTLAFLNWNHCLVWLVEMYNSNIGCQPGRATITALRALLPTAQNNPTEKPDTYPYQTFGLFKDRANAFSHTELECQLRQNMIHSLVIMGQAADVCVAETIFGENSSRQGSYHTHSEVTPHNPSSYGAIDRGFTVLTSQDIVTGGHCTWKSLPNICFFTSAGAIPRLKSEKLQQVLQKKHLSTTPS